MKAIKTFCYHAPLLLAGLLFITAACDKEDKDTAGPTITLKEPVEGDTAHAGEAHGLHIELDLADESGLNTYKIDIHYGEGHSHESLLKAAANNWSYQKTYDNAKGLKNYHVHVHSDSIPANATLGEYHFGISATDVHGNETSVYRTFHLVEHDEDDHDDHDHDDD
ncbi:MAG: DUF4625 domain-containing protein [Prevotellaceae bacterium]|jgi:hypothetical protein|nr:DUF4625 domain-containing protein [Prevotellaceae bacterium]